METKHEIEIAHVRRTRDVSKRAYCTEGIFWDVIGTKILSFFHAIHSHLYQLNLLPSMVSLDIRFLKVGGGWALFILSLCLPLKVAMFFLLLLFIYK
jgi:hypothetical protein